MPIPIVLCGIDHPHTEEWYTVLQRVPDLTPVAHYDPRAEASRMSLAPPYNDLPLYSDLDALRAQHEIEAALILLPLPEAESTMLALAQADIHVLAEKPVARTADALRAVAARMAPGLVFYSGYLWRLDPIMQEVHDLIRKGILGDLWSLEMHWITSRVGRRAGVPAHRDPDSYLFRKEISRGGMLQWLGCHHLDLMAHLAGAPVTSVTAMTSRQTTTEIEVEDTATCLLRFKPGTLASLHVGYLLPAGGQQYLGVRGSLGWMRWSSEDGRCFTVHSEHPDWSTAPTRVLEFPRPPDATYGGGTAEVLLRDFTRCIHRDGGDPMFTIDDAIRVLEILDAAYESADQGRTVEISWA